MTRIVCNTALAITLIIGGLAANAADKKAKTKAGDAKPTDSAAAPGFLPDYFKVDLAASTVKWTGSKITGSSHDGLVKLKAGQVEVSHGMLNGGNFEIDMNSITNDDLKDSPKDQAKLVGHLKSDDFFDTKKFPTALFKITSVKPLTPAKAGDPTHEITGDLTLKGKTLPTTFQAIVTLKEAAAEASATLKIDRTKWDIRYGSGKFFTNLGDRVIKDEFTMDLKLVAAK